MTLSCICAIHFYAEKRVIVLFYDYNGGGDGPTAEWSLLMEFGTGAASVLCGLTAAARGILRMPTSEFLQHIRERGYDSDSPAVLRLFRYHKVGEGTCGCPGSVRSTCHRPPCDNGPATAYIHN